MKLVRYLIFGIIIILPVRECFSYDAVERTRLLEDRLKLQEDLRKLGHDFLIDINAYLSSDIQDLVSDVSDVSKASNTITAASELLDQWDGKELSFRGVANLGIPFFSTYFGGIKFVPELLRVHIGTTVNIGIGQETLTLADLLDLLPDSFPSEVKTAVLSLDLSDGDDIVSKLQSAFPELDGVSGFSYSDHTGKYTVPTGFSNGLPIPNLNFYAKLDLKAGPKVAYIGKHFFGHFSIYGMGRSDLELRLTTDTLQNSGTGIEIPKGIETWNIAIDYALGYQNSNYKITASVEELKVSTLSEATDSTVSYGHPVLLKLHGEANFRPWGFLLASPFLGIHTRKGYSVGDAYYAGVDFGAYLWGDRLGLQLRGMIDREHITIAPRIKFWIIQIEGMLKTPVKSSIDGVKLGSLYGINFRLFI